MRFTGDQARELARKAVAGEGHTEYAFSDALPAGRYVVGGMHTDVTSNTEDIAHVLSVVKRVIEYANQHINVGTVGVWLDDGLLYVDAGDTHTTLSSALQWAAQRGELAIYDRHTNRVIDVPQAA